MTAAELRDWKTRLGLSNEGAADALRVSPHTLHHYLYRPGHKLPRDLDLKCAAVEAGVVVD